MSLDGTRLDRDAYRAHVVSDAARIVAVAGTSPERPVPTCPGWAVTDLARHVGEVYAHKVAAVRLGREPAEGEWETGPASGIDISDWLAAQAAEMVEVVYAADPAAPAWTWWGPEQTCGFWQRRMAQESLVHRLDGELAVGAPHPLDPVLAADGCDEILGWLAWPWAGMPQAEAAGQSVRVSCGDHSWLVVLEPEEVRVVGASGAGAEGAAASADAVVTGSPADLLLWLWGRPVAEGAVVESGDAVPVRLMRERLAMSTT